MLSGTSFSERPFSLLDRGHRLLNFIFGLVHQDLFLHGEVLHPVDAFELLVGEVAVVDLVAQEASLSTMVAVSSPETAFIPLIPQLLSDLGHTVVSLNRGVHQVPFRGRESGIIKEEPALDEVRQDLHVISCGCCP